MTIQAKAAGVACALSILTAMALPGLADATPTPAPAWKLLAASGPTNLPPKQSEVQRVIVEGEAGTFTLTRRSGEGSATPVTQSGAVLRVEADSDEATILTGSYEVGERLTSTRLPAETTIVDCSADCETGGSKLTLSKPAESKGNTAVTIFTKKLSGATAGVGDFHPGDIIVGEGIVPGTVITEVNGTTLTTTRATTAAYASGPIELTILEGTTPLPFNASAADLQAALAAMPAFAPGSFTVSGGPGGDAGHPYFIAFGGPGFTETNVEEFTGVGQGLGAHGFVHVFTTVPGGPGTGEIVVLPTNIGGAPTSGPYSVTLGPLPAGIVTSGQATGENWSCPSSTGLQTVTCTSGTSVPRFNPASGIAVPVEVEGQTGLSGTVPVTITGGSAGSADYQLPVTVTTVPAAPGGLASWAGSYEVDGTVSVQAGGHPASAMTYFILNTVRALNGTVVPAGDSKDVIVDLPAGFSGNPMVTSRCPQSQVIAPGQALTPLCNKEMKLGTFQPIINSLHGSSAAFATPFFNDVPPRGYAAEFTTKIAVISQSILASLRTEEDFGIRITAPNNSNTFPIYGAFAQLEGFPVAAQGKPFISNPTSCVEEARQAPMVRSQFDTWQKPGVFSHINFQLEPVTGCERLALHPSFTLRPTSANGSSPVGVTAHLHLPQKGLTDPEALVEPPLKTSVVRLPAGLALNPSQANGLQACSEAQVGYVGTGELPNPTRFNDKPVMCPDGSKVGTIEASSPVLEEPLRGTVYLAEQERNPFGSLIALYLVFESPRFGITMKLPGKVDTNPITGQITASFNYLPQQPVEDLTLRFRGGGPRSEFATPEVCGTYATTGSWTPWSAPESGPPATTRDSFSVSANCASSAATRPFSPSFEAGSASPVAGAYAPLVIRVNRNDGEQELRSLDFNLPPGLSGRLAGIPYCSDAQIAAAAAKTGRAELAAPSCPAASELGTVDTAAGVGSAPFHVQGHVYLAGPYKGAPVSSVVITPAVAGPFDLGDVVIRAPVYVNPVTAQLTVKSDPIPTILRGIPLKVRSVSIDVGRPGFGLNPTNCEVMSATASIGSSNGAIATPSNRFQVGGCRNLKFKPRLQIRLKGGTRRNANPALVATLRQGPGQANIAFTSVALPHSEFLEQGHIKTICTRVQFAAKQCPKASIYGRAEAVTPLLDQPLRGPVYLRSSSHRLPDMVVALRGPAWQPIEVDLDGRIDSIHGGIRTTFETVPDAPVSKFVLRMRGGKKSLLVNSTNICRRVHKNTVRMTGQNGRQHNFRPPLKAQCGKHAKKHKRHRKEAKRHSHKRRGTR